MHMDATDQAFIEAVRNLPSSTATRELSPIQSFCMRLADGLEKLPPRVSNNVQLEFLQKIIELENKYLTTE